MQTLTLDSRLFDTDPYASVAWNEIPAPIALCCCQPCGGRFPSAPSYMLLAVHAGPYDRLRHVLRPVGWEGRREGDGCWKPASRAAFMAKNH